MELQQIKNTFQLLQDESSPVIQQVFNNSDKLRTRHIALKRQNQIYRHYYLNFSPYSDYFNNKRSHICLHKSRKEFHSHSKIYDQQRLSLQRQSMHYRGAVDQYLQDELLNQLLNESKNDKGFVNKKRNCSLIIKNVLYFAHNCIVQAIELPRQNKERLIQIFKQSKYPKRVIDFGQGNNILQLQEFKTHLHNSSSTQYYIMIRFSRKIIIFNIQQNKIIYQISTSSQFIQFNPFFTHRNKFQTLQYDGIHTHFHSYQYNLRNKSFKKNQQCYQFDNLVHSIFNINQNEYCMIRYESIVMFDKRNNMENLLRKSKLMKTQRFYSSIPVRGMYNFTPYVVACQSRGVSLMDIRKPEQAVIEWLHQCQQAPPQVIQFYDGCYQNILHSPIISCHSPYPMGSSMFKSINIPLLNQSPSNLINQKHKIHLKQDYFSLLYDLSKQNSTSNFFSFNNSLSFSNSSSNNLQIYEIDIHGSINLEAFQINQFSNTYKSSIVKHSFEQENQELSKSDHQLWLKQNLENKYFNETFQYQKIQLNEQLITKKSDKQKKLSKNKKYKDAKIIAFDKKDTPTEIEEQQVQGAEYQNQYDCPQTFSKRKLNYANFQNFTRILEQRVIKQQSKPQNQSKPIQKDHFINSTQPSSQGFSFSNTFSEQITTNTLSFHNKKGINMHLLEKMKHDWNN